MNNDTPVTPETKETIKSLDELVDLYSIDLAYAARSRKVGTLDAEIKKFKKALTQRELQSQILSEHYWIKYYGDQRKFCDGSDGDMPEINELKRHQQLHKDRLAYLESKMNRRTE